MRIGEICTRTVVTCGRTASALELAQLMRNHHVGDVIVVDAVEGGSTPVGIVTDRDLVVLVMAKGVDPELLSAGDMMTDELVTAPESEDVYDAIWHMRSQGVRRLPIVDAKSHLCGVLTSDDVTEFLAAEMVEMARIMPRQIRLEETEREPVTR